MNIDKLKPYPRELTSFLTYVKKHTKLDIFLKLDFKFQLGWYIAFLSEYKLAVVVNNVSYRIYYSGSSLVRKKTISNITILDLWELAIIEAFNYLERPF